jgi:hypothetical protein
MVEDIEECIQDLMTLCSQHKVPMLLAIQDTPSSYRALGANENLAMGQQLRHMRMLIRAGDIDSFLRNLIREAEQNGHRSILLRAMGIAEEPKN